MPLKTILISLFALFLIQVRSQGLTCAESEPFCTGTIYDFPAGTLGNAETGPFYGCLSSQPAPAWYHMKIGNPGPITIYMHSEPHEDIDFACWGPFTDPVSPCLTGLTSDKMVDCCYCNSWEETCDIPNGQTGEYYILLITNFSRQVCNIVFSQTGGAGSTDCSILPPLVSSDSPLCIGDTLHLTAEDISNATYTWTGPAGFSSTLQNPVIPNVTLAQAGDYSCVITVYGSTSPPAVTTVVINDLPNASLVNSSMTTCPGGEAFMIVQLTGTGPFEVIYFDGSSYIIAPGLTGPVDTIVVSPPGPATYNLTQVSDANCTRALSGIIFQVLNFPPATGMMTGGEIICPGDTAELIFNLTGTPPWTITYLTNGMNPQTITADYSPFTVEVTPLASTTYSFTALYDAYCVGAASGQVVITVDYPVGSMSGDNTICSGDGAQLQFILTGFPPWTIKYTANGTNEQTVIANTSPYSIPVNPTESTLYEFTFLEDEYCTGEPNGEAMITIHQPLGVLDGNSTICEGESTEIVFNLEGNPPWIIKYSENGGNVQTLTAYSTPYTVSVEPLLSTIYAFTYFEDDQCEGIATGEATVTVNPLPVVNAGNDKTIANGTYTTLNGSVSGGSGSFAIQWQPADKLVDPVVLQPTTVNLFSSTLFTLTITDNNGGCFSSDEILVTITGGVLSCTAQSSPNVICFGETSQLQAIASGGSGNYTYMWSSSPPGFSSDLQNPVVNPTFTTSYNVTVNDGYNVTQGNTMVAVDQPPMPNAGSDQMIVFGTTTRLHGSVSSGSGNCQYHWEPGFKLQDPDCAEPVTVNLFETTLFSLTVNDSETGCVCVQPDEVTVMINGSALTANPVAQPATICSGETTQLHCLAGGGTGSYTYSWTSTPPGFTSGESDPVVAPMQSTVYFVSVSDGFNSVGGTVGVTVNPKPFVRLGSDTTVCVFDTIILDAGNPGASYIWSNGSTDRRISIGSTGIGYENKLVSVTVTSPEGCESTDERYVAFDFVACSGIGDLEDKSYLKVYPNPGNGLINLENTGISGKAVVSVFNSYGTEVLGNLILDFTESKTMYKIDIQSYRPGLYLIKLDFRGNHKYLRYILSR